MLVQEEPFWKEIDAFYGAAPRLFDATLDVAGGGGVSERQPVTFANRRGERLVGIVHAPADGGGDTAVVLLSPGVKTRVAPHRLYNKLAEALVAQGYWVFRFDFYGLGDSEGEVAEAYLADLYGSVALGRYVDDTRDALDWMSGTIRSSGSSSAGCAAAPSPGSWPARRSARRRADRPGAADHRRGPRRRQGGADDRRPARPDPAGLPPQARSIRVRGRGS